MGESGRTMSNMDMMMADQAARQGISSSRAAYDDDTKDSEPIWAEPFPIEMPNFSVWVKSVLKRR